MSKIAIVGVEGSGKSTLMAVLGEKYATPDAHGISLEPKDVETMSTVGVAIAAMREGRWPSATVSSKIQALNWTILRSAEGAVREVGDVVFLDYAGEVYRLAFGQHAEETTAPFQRQIEALKSHIESAEALIVLVNLADVIDGDRTESRIWEMIFQTGNIVRMAVEKGVRVAMTFSQADKYDGIVESVGGLSAAYVKYLPHVATRYPKLTLFSVAAVDKTSVDAAGNEIPAHDFGSRGLDDLMKWIVEGDFRRSTVEIESSPGVNSHLPAGRVSAEDVRIAICDAIRNPRLICGESLSSDDEAVARRQMDIDDGVGEVLMFYDTSCFRSMSSGLALTPCRIYLKESWKDARWYAWNAIESVVALNDRPEIVINECSLVLTGCSVAQSARIAEGIRKLAVQAGASTDVKMLSGRKN